MSSSQENNSKTITNEECAKTDQVKLTKSNPYLKNLDETANNMKDLKMLVVGKIFEDAEHQLQKKDEEVKTGKLIEDLKTNNSMLVNNNYLKIYDESKINFKHNDKSSDDVSKNINPIEINSADDIRKIMKRTINGPQFIEKIDNCTTKNNKETVIPKHNNFKMINEPKKFLINARAVNKNGTPGLRKAGHKVSNKNNENEIHASRKRPNKASNGEPLTKRRKLVHLREKAYSNIYLGKLANVVFLHFRNDSHRNKQ